MTASKRSPRAACGSGTLDFETELSRLLYRPESRLLDGGAVMAAGPYRLEAIQGVGRAKADEFNEYARRSDLKDVTPDAVDISDLTAAKEAATQAENERCIVEMERKRLRMEEAERKGR